MRWGRNRVGLQRVARLKAEKRGIGAGTIGRK